MRKYLFNIPNDKEFSYIFGGEYRINKRIIKIFTFLLMFYLVFCFFQIVTHERYYIINDNPVSIENPVYLSDNGYFPVMLRQMEFLPSGFEAGYNHAWYVASAPVIGLLILMLMFIINHFVYNKNYGKGV